MAWRPGLRRSFWPLALQAEPRSPQLLTAGAVSLVQQFRFSASAAGVYAAVPQPAEAAAAQPSAKRPPTAYGLFKDKHSADIKKKNPGVKGPDLTALVRKEYKALKKADVQKLEAEATALRGKGKTISSYSLFTKENYARIKAGKADLALKDVAAQLAKLWKGLPAAEKNNYKQRAAAM